MNYDIYYNDVGEANLKLERARDRAGVFRNAAIMAGKLCSLRKSQFCYLDCDCRVVCDVSGLIPLRWAELPEHAKEVIRVV